MGKSKRRKAQVKAQQQAGPNSTGVLARKVDQHKPNRVQKPQLKAKHVQQNPQHLRPVLPFSSSDNILLVGEGDFSFAHSLFVHHPHNFKFLCATCYDSRDELLEKYPQTDGITARLLRAPEEKDQIAAVTEPEVPGDEHDVEQTSNADFTSFSSSAEAGDVGTSETQQEQIPIIGEGRCSVMYSVDATALHKQKLLRKRKWDRIVFNFPHVGGKSTDVNRQVRYNQALLHDFMKSCISLLSIPDGTILITLFEGSPYELWNIRDLARSAGLRVVRSFAFNADLYPGYEHARTLGNIHSKNNATQDKAEVQGAEARTHQTTSPARNRPGKWRGEERKARTYEFGLNASTGLGTEQRVANERKPPGGRDSSEEID